MSWIRRCRAHPTAPRCLLVGAALVVALSIAVVSVLAGRVHNELAEQARQFQENDQWAVYQLQKEHLRTLLAARRALAGDAEALDGLQTQFDILASRLMVLREGIFANEVLADRQGSGVADQLQAAVDTVDRQVAEGAAGARLAAAIHDAMAPLEAPLQGLVMAHLAATVDAKVRQEEKLRGFVAMLEYAFIGAVLVIVVLGGFAFLALMRAEARRRALDAEQKIRALLEDSVEQRKLRALGALAGGIAHEINTPAQWILDNLSFLRHGLGEIGGWLQAPPQADPARRQEAEALLAELDAAGADAVSGVERISRIVRAVRPFATEAEEAPETFRLAAGLRDAILLCRSTYRDIAVVELVATDPDMELCGPRQSFIYVIAEIVGNAAEAIRQCRKDGMGAIRIELAGGATGAVIRISDDGIGIGAEDLAQVFDPFFSTRAGFGVYGQGLAVCKTSIESRFGGRIAVDSVPGEGTCVTITLPAARRAGRAADAAPAAGPGDRTVADQRAVPARRVAAALGGPGDA